MPWIARKRTRKVAEARKRQIECEGGDDSGSNMDPSEADTDAQETKGKDNSGSLVGSKTSFIC
eukprot:15364465-Ditylum_brightwellii.AAC.1